MSYSPPFLLRNGHLNTIYTSVFRQVPDVQWERERITTFDQDFIDIDRKKAGNRKVVILCHGLEGSSESKYIQGTGDLCFQNGFDVCAMNYRFCSGEINLKPQMYHSGWTPDLEVVIRHVLPDYEQIHLIGLSLGGNLVLKYSGEDLFEKSPKLASVCAVSVPLNLNSSSLEMEKFENKLYSNRFLKTLNHKIKLKAEQFPDLIDPSHIPKIKTVRDFDDYYTGPLNGFANALDYYEKCSSDQFLSTIMIPALIINAYDDPFLGPECYPAESDIRNSLLHLEYTKYGGHVGFYERNKYMWSEKKVVDFIVQQSA